MNPQIQLPQDLTPQDIIIWRKKILETAKPITWNGYLRHMRSLYNFAIDNEFIDISKNPFLRLSLKTGKEKRKVLTKDQLIEIEKVISTKQDLPKYLEPRWFILALVQTFRYTGMRRGQLVGLKISDVDLDKAIIRLPSVINKNHNYHEIPISLKLLPYLQKLISELREKGLDDNAQLFNINIFSKSLKISDRQRNMTDEQVSYIMVLISKAVGYIVSTHRFRHTIATELMKNIDNLYFVKQLLGHSDIKVTLGYIEYNSEQIRACVNSLD